MPTSTFRCEVHGEIHRGIHNGPQCANNYINTHCVAGRKYTCLSQQQCDCSSLRRLALPKVQKPQHQPVQQQQQQHTVTDHGSCTAAGRACCVAAARSCPHPESGALCLMETRNGIHNGPECKKNYIHSHCEAGHMHVCFEKEHCNCLALPDIQKVVQKRQEVPLVQQADSSRSNSQCGATGRNCCRKKLTSCPYPNSGDACLTEIHAGVQQGPNCKQNYIHSHCMADGMFSCRSQHHCDCLQVEDGSIEQLYAISAGAAGSVHLHQHVGHPTTAAAAKAASAVLLAATFSLVVALVTWSVRRRPCTNYESLRIDSEDEMSM